MVSEELLQRVLPEWHVYAEADDMFELSRHSPLGEEILLDVQGKTLDELADSAFQYYDDFDADDHASEIYHAKHHGDENARRFYASAPDDLGMLLKDARDIDNMYYEVGDKLRQASIEMEGGEE